MTAKFTNPLDSIKVASPCAADWEAMVGNNRQRHCGDCQLDVYNLSGMTKNEAENLIINAEGRLCARFYRRADGTVITKDCPVGWAAVKKRLSKFWTATASVVIAAVGSIGITAFVNQTDETTTMGTIAIENTRIPQKDHQPKIEEISVQPKENLEMTMGEIAMPEEEPAGVTMGKMKLPSK